MRILLFAFLAISFLPFPALDAVAQQPQVSIQILATFDYPGVGNSTLPQKIHDQGNVAG
jgi:hypothetical protein